MRFMVSPKWPGMSAMLVLGLFIGSLIVTDFLTAMITGVCFLIDCCRFEKAKEGELIPPPH